MADLVYATTIVLRHPEPGEFARVLGPAPTGTRYRDYAPERTTSTRAARWEPEPLIRETKAPRKRERVNETDRKCPRWTQERVNALPRKSGWLTRIGDALDTGRQHKPLVPCECSGSSPRCRKRILVEASVYASDGRPQSCRPCAHERRRKAAAFTEKGYATARDFAVKQRENEPSAKGEAA